MTLSVAVIGSFKQFYDEVLDAIEAFRGAGWIVASPAGSEVIEAGIEFVRFVTDSEDDGDALVQTRTLVNILGADLTYVVAPKGYVGRTTCYEVGRVIQAGQPLYFSSLPADLPLHVPERCVASPAELIAQMRQGQHPSWLFAEGDGLLFDLERQLTNGG